MTVSSRQKFAVLDLGSNSFHLDIAEVSRKRIRKIHKQKEMVYLGRGLDSNGLIRDATLEKAFNALNKFSPRLRHMSRDRVKVIGTSILRQAHNSDYFLRTAEKIIGHPILLISGEREADYIYHGVNRYYEKSRESKLIIDIGGGSTEVIRGTGSQILDKESLTLGCGPITEQYFTDGEITSRSWSDAVSEVQKRLHPYIRRFRRRNSEQVIGTSGTMKGMYRGLKSLKLAKKKTFRTDLLTELKEYILGAGHIRNISLKKVKSRKRPVYPAGLAILTGICSAFNIQQIHISKAAVREGVLYSLYERRAIRTKSEVHFPSDYLAAAPELGFAT